MAEIIVPIGHGIMICILGRIVAFADVWNALIVLVILFGVFVAYIISKPVEKVTLNDYTILHEELKDLRFRKDQEASGDRFKKLMATAFPDAGFAAGGR